MDTVALGVIAPLFGIMAAGFASARVGLIDERGSEAIGRFVFFVSLPALAMISLSRVTMAEFFDWPFLGSLVGGMAITFAASLAAARLMFPGTLTERGLHALTAMFSSTAYVALPIILVVYGDRALAPAMTGAVLPGALFLPVAIALAEIDRGEGRRAMLLAPLLGVVRNPVILSAAAGLAISASGLALPGPAVRFLDLLAGAFIPCALFSAGLFMAQCTVRGDRVEIGWLSLVKLVLHPLVTWWLAARVFSLDPLLVAVAVIHAAAPTGVPVFVLAQRYGAFVSRSSAAIVVSTVLSVVTLTVLVRILVE